jgi:hypothetical protein
MVWGCFSYYGVGSLVKVNGLMEQKQYKSILQRHLCTSAKKLYGNKKWIFQHDNDPKHTSKTVKNYLSNKSRLVLKWPSQSPDLNPIENLWSELDRVTKHRKPQNEEELMEVLTNAWNTLPVSYLHNLVDSMPRRMQAVLDNDGFPTKY